MKMKEAVQYLFDKAIKDGYDPFFLRHVEPEIEEIVNMVEDCSIEVLDRLYEELF